MKKNGLLLLAIAVLYVTASSAATPALPTAAGGCSGTDGIDSLRLDGPTCLSVRSNNCNGGIIEIDNKCNAELYLGNQIISGYEDIELFLDEGGNVKARLSDGNFADFKPKHKTILEIRGSIGSQQVRLRYRKVLDFKPPAQSVRGNISYARDNDLTGFGILSTPTPVYKDVVLDTPGSIVAHCYGEFSIDSSSQTNAGAVSSIFVNGQLCSKASSFNYPSFSVNFAATATCIMNLPVGQHRVECEVKPYGQEANRERFVGGSFGYQIIPNSSPFGR